MAIVLNQMFHYNLNFLIKNLYYKGKGYEFCRVCFSIEMKTQTQQCPLLIEIEENVLKN
jgi:hypothetical protein